MKAKQLRKLWYQFWEEKNHLFLSSRSLVSQDPSLLWTNSGIAAIKDFFLGTAQPPAPRLVNIQKVVRTNDISQIGLTNHHLSFFEMMGNFSLGSYFKREAIVWGWEFLTSKKWLNLAKKNLYVTIYHQDKAALKICQTDLKIPSQQIFLKGKKTNFWDLGVGPCGPNLEIFYDLGNQFDPTSQGVKLLEEDLDNDRYLEIWNIVFSEFVNLGNDNFQPLPKKNIDTGAGFERLLMVLQKKTTVFETDLFAPIFTALRKILPNVLEEKIFSFPSTKVQQRLIIIVDHLKTATFLLSDLLATNTSYDFQNKHGYVIRKLLRRAFYQFSLLTSKQNFLFPLVPEIIATLSDTYPYLVNFQKQVMTIFQQEEINFKNIFSNQQVVKIFHQAKTTQKISGKVLFQLITALGVPPLFLKALASEENWQLAWKEYDQLHHDHQNLSRQKKNLSHWKVVNFTNKRASFFNEEKTSLADVKVLEIIVEEKSLSKISNQTCWLLWDKTIFYATKGGQVADQGSFTSLNSKGKVLDVITNDYKQHWHWVKVEGQLAVGDNCQIFLDQKRRLLTANNHSATHLLHSVLRKIVGPELKQNGSLNNQDYLRLDFVSPKLIISQEILSQAEKEVNLLIEAKITPQIFWVSPKEAKEIGALDFSDLGKDFSDQVRVVEFRQFSRELCGGTHVKNTTLLEKFIITNFTKISKNNYRIYALTSKKTIAHFWNKWQEEWKKFKQKYAFFLPQFLHYQQLSQLGNQLESGNLSYLVWKKAFISWQNLAKITAHQIIQKEITKLITNQPLSPKNIHSLAGEEKLVFFPLLASPLISKNSPFLFLDKFLTTHQTDHFKIFFVYLSQDKTTSYYFCCSFSSRWINFPWKEKFFHQFANQVQFGIKNQQLKGVFHCHPGEILTFLKTLITNHK